MPEPMSEPRGNDAAKGVRHGNIGMGVAIVSLIAFLLIAVTAFWLINGNSIGASELRPAPSAAPASGPGQIGNVADSAAPPHR